MKDSLCNAPGTQIPDQSSLMFRKAGRNSRRGKVGGEVQVQASIDAAHAGDRRGALGILHENHRAYGRDRPGRHAFENAVSCLPTATPVISVDDEGSAASV